MLKLLNKFPEKNKIVNNANLKIKSPIKLN